MRTAITHNRTPSYQNSLSPCKCIKSLIIYTLMIFFPSYLAHCPWNCNDLDAVGLEARQVQVMAWYRQATSLYLSQSWHRSMSSYGVTGPQRVNPLVISLVLFIKIFISMLNLSNKILMVIFYYHRTLFRIKNALVDKTKMGGWKMW